MYCIKLLSFFVIAVIFNEGSALNCFECIGPPNGGCSNGNLADLIKLPCSQTKFMQKAVAVHMELENAVQINTVCAQAKLVVNNVTAVERACGFTPDGVDFCEALKRVVKVISCSSCTSSYCNSKAFKYVN